MISIIFLQAAKQILLFCVMLMTGSLQPTEKPTVPKELDWDLWLGTAQYKDYIDNLIPFNWRGWWDYGTGALGDMACHIMQPAFAVLGLGYPVGAECSVSTRYIANWQQA